MEVTESRFISVHSLFRNWPYRKNLNIKYWKHGNWTKHRLFYIYLSLFVSHPPSAVYMYVCTLNRLYRWNYYKIINYSELPILRLQVLRTLDKSPICQYSWSYEDISVNKQNATNLVNYFAPFKILSVIQSDLRPHCCVLIASNILGRLLAKLWVKVKEDSYDCNYVEHYVTITSTTCWVIVSNCAPGQFPVLAWLNVDPCIQQVRTWHFIDMVNLSKQLQNLVCECVW